MIIVAEQIPNAVCEVDSTLSIRPEACIQMAVDGCPDARGHLFHRYDAYLLRIARRELPNKLRSKLDPDDVVQESWLAALDGFGCFTGSSENELRLWLRTILLNRISDAARRFQTAKRAVSRECSLEAYAREHLIPASLGGSGSSCELSIRGEQIALLHDALLQLPESYRQVIALRSLEQLPFAEVGATMGRSTEAAHKRWKRATKRLRAILASRSQVENAKNSNRQSF